MGIKDGLRRWVVRRLAPGCGRRFARCLDAFQDEGWSLVTAGGPGAGIELDRVDSHPGSGAAGSRLGAADLVDRRGLGGSDRDHRIRRRTAASTGGGRQPGIHGMDTNDAGAAGGRALARAAHELAECTRRARGGCTVALPALVGGGGRIVIGRRRTGGGGGGAAGGSVAACVAGDGTGWFALARGGEHGGGGGDRGGRHGSGEAPAASTRADRELFRRDGLEWFDVETARGALRLGALSVSMEISLGWCWWFAACLKAG